MPIDVKIISEAESKTILNLQENHFCDLKAIDIEPGKLTRSIASFANADGGEIYVGIDENRTTNSRFWRGFSAPELANGHIQTFEALFPLSNDFDYTFLECNNLPGLILQIQIRKTSAIKKASDGKVYLRRGAQNLPITTHDGLKQLEFVKGITSFEVETVNTDESYITESQPTYDFMQYLVPSRCCSDSIVFPY
ncbi:MAG: ATP-binding protein [Armatimonas sp.]